MIRDSISSTKSRKGIIMQSRLQLDLHPLPLLSADPFGSTGLILDTQFLKNTPYKPLN